MFKNGIKFPYNPNEIYTSVSFQNKQMHIFLDVNENADRFLDNEFLDDDTKIDALHMHRITPKS